MSPQGYGPNAPGLPEHTHVDGAEGGQLTLEALIDDEFNRLIRSDNAATQSVAGNFIATGGLTSSSGLDVTGQVDIRETGSGLHNCDVVLHFDGYRIIIEGATLTADRTLTLRNETGGVITSVSAEITRAHKSTTMTYISGTGTAGADNTAQTVKSIDLPANTLTQVGDRMRIRTYWTGDTGGALTGTVKVGPSGSEVSVSDTTDTGAATLQLNEAWLHYIDNTHANIIENEAGGLGTLSAVNVAGFTWASAQKIIFTQDAAVANHAILYALIVDVFPKGA